MNKLKDDLVCYAMSGKMDVFYTGPSASVIEDYMMYHLRVELDSQNVLVGAIDRTFFVGKSTENPYNLVAEGDEDRGAQNSQNSEESTGILPLVLGIPIALALIIAVGLFVTRRKRKSDSSEISSQQVETIDDPEYGSRSGDLPLTSKSQPMVLAETDSSEKSEDEDKGAANLSSDSIFDDVEAGSVEEVGSDAPMLMDLEVSTGNEADPALLQNSAALALAVAATSLTPVGAQNPFDLAPSKEDNAQSGETSLPPLPPGVRPAKIVATIGQSARRRRRKKKRTAAERMSGTPEMATIQETPENSDNEDDESYGSGSEQSWSGSEENDSPQHHLPFQGSPPGFASAGHPDQNLSFDETLVTDNRTFTS